MSHIKNKNLFNLILCFSIFALCAAYFTQHVLGHLPCNLCLIERIPYFLVIIIIVISFVFNKYEKIYLGLLSIIFISATFVSFYHFGIEQGFIKESLVCDLDFQGNNLTAGEILNELKKKTVSCKDVTFSIFGISLATFNALISAGLSAIIIKKIFNYEQNK